MERSIPQHLIVGRAGEDIACKYLQNKGYKIIERNFRRKWGEIDIVCSAKPTLNNPFYPPVIHKSVVWRLWEGIKNVLQVTKNCSTDFEKEEEIPLTPFKKGERIIFVEVKALKSGDLNPEDNVTLSKQRKLIRTCELYMASHHFDPDTDWQIDVVAIKIDMATKKASVNHIENAVYYS